MVFFFLLLNQCYMVLFYHCTNRFQWMIGSDYLRYDLLYIQGFVISSYKCPFFQFKERLKDVLKPCHDDFYLLRWLRGIFISALHKVKYMYFLIRLLGDFTIYRWWNIQLFSILTCMKLFCSKKLWFKQVRVHAKKCKSYGKHVW